MAGKLAQLGIASRRLCALVATVLLGGAWVTLDAARVRLVDGGMTQGHRLAGVQIELDPGWKTYWRVPGESGVPPEFDWSGSDNLKHAEVLFPAPARLHDQGGEAIGYKDGVTFPVEVEASDPAKPVSLALALHFAVCQAICVPAEATLTLTLPAAPVPDADDALVRAALAKVPSATAGVLAVSEAKLEPVRQGEGYELMVRLDGTGAGDADIFVEGFADAYFGRPRPLEAAARSAAYRLPVFGLKQPDELIGKPLTLTVVAGERSVVRSVIVR
jgi:DsbC/DsbD-like thiol-disulfide interchange protein